MSRVELSEFLDAYLGEVEEHLASSNAQLLALDAALRAGEPTLRCVRELFRALHTIKGLSAMVGVEPVVAIAHRMETALRTADRAGGRLPEGAIDVMLQGVAGIEQRVRALAGGRPVAAPARELLASLDALDEPPFPPPQAGETTLSLEPAVDGKLAAFERDVLARGVAGGRRAVCARFAPSPERADAGNNINTVRERLAAVAEIVKVVPVATPRTAATPAGLTFALLALTRASDEEVAGAVGIDVADVSSVAEPGARSAHAPAPRVASPGVPRPSASEADASSGATPAAASPGVDSGEAIEEPDHGDETFRRGMVRVDVVKLDDALERLAQLVVSRAKLAREIALLAERAVDVRGLTTVLREQSRHLRDLRASILSVRMVSVNEVLERVPLLLRGLRRSTGKTVRLSLDTGRAELDKAVAERLFPAIVHLVRNAVDHAIEPSEERLRAGKPAEGRLRISATARGNGRLELTVDDDGRGIDAAAVAARAGREVPATEAALLTLLCRPGLSTRDEVSTTSGRGMGMDIVRRIVVDQLGGELLLATTPGAGTRFTLRVPLTLSIIDALTFECAAQRFAVSMSTIDEILEIDAADVASPPGRRAGTEISIIRRRGEAVPLVRLDRALGLVGVDPERPKAIVVLREGEPIAFAVDRMLGQQEVVVRPLEDPLCRAPGIAGATDLGDGRPTLVVDLLALGVQVAEAARSLEARS